MNEANAYTIRPATAADSTMIKRTVRQARLDRTGLDWRNFKIAELVKNGDMIGFCQVRRYASVPRAGQPLRAQDLSGPSHRRRLDSRLPGRAKPAGAPGMRRGAPALLRALWLSPDSETAGAAGVGSQVVHRRNAGLAGSTPNHYRYALGGLTSTRVTIHVCRSAARTPPATAFLG